VYKYNVTTGKCRGFSDITEPHILFSAVCRFYLTAYRQA